MTLSALIRKRDTASLATAIPAIFATDQTQAGGVSSKNSNCSSSNDQSKRYRASAEGSTVARIATVAVATLRSEKTGAGETAPYGAGSVGAAASAAQSSIGWLLHYPDREPALIFRTPPVGHAEVLAEHPDAIAAEPFRPEVRPPSAPLTGTERRRILSWLGWIGEVDRSVIALIDQCERDADARAYYLGRAAEAPEDDRRICLECRNLAGRRCLAAARGEIVASRNYEPIRDLPRRCEGYVPGPDDADRRPGRERWPGLIQKGGE